MASMFKVDPRSPRYVYLQLADHVESLIGAGELVVGDRLAGEVEMADKYGVARLTVRRAVRELRDRGLVVTVPAKGTFIAQGAD